jgi:hypothetical protein
MNFIMLNSQTSMNKIHRELHTTIEIKFYTYENKNDNYSYCCFNSYIIN